MMTLRKNYDNGNYGAIIIGTETEITRIAIKLDICDNCNSKKISKDNLSALKKELFGWRILNATEVMEEIVFNSYGKDDIQYILASILPRYHLMGRTTLFSAVFYKRKDRTLSDTFYRKAIYSFSQDTFEKWYNMKKAALEK